MWHPILTSCVVLGLFVTRLCAEGLIASPEPDWPQWRGIRRDGISSERGLLASWPEGGPRLLWKSEALGIGWSSPIIVGKRIYITGDVDEDLVIFALALDGSKVWSVKNGRSWTRSYPGARASCVFSEGHIFHMNAHGRTVCLDMETGREVWAVDVRTRFDAKNITWALSECLLVDGPHVIVTPGGNKGLIAALNKTNGQTAWVTPPLTGERTSYSSPILFELAGRRIIANCSSAHGFGVDAQTGQLLWTVPLKNRFGANITTPVYRDACIFYVTPYAEEGRVYRLQADGQGVTPQLVWHYPLDTVTGGAVLVGNTLYSAGYRRNKWWMGVDWKTGKLRCEQKGFSTGAAIWADQRLYCLDERGNVGLLKPGPDTLEIAGRFELVKKRVRDAWAHPVLLDGRLYLRYHESLFCYDVRSRQRSDQPRNDRRIGVGE